MEPMTLKKADHKELFPPNFYSIARDAASQISNIIPFKVDFREGKTRWSFCVIGPKLYRLAALAPAKDKNAVLLKLMFAGRKPDGFGHTDYTWWETVPGPGEEGGVLVGEPFSLTSVLGDEGVRSFSEMCSRVIVVHSEWLASKQVSKTKRKTRLV